MEGARKTVTLPQTLHTASLKPALQPQSLENPERKVKLNFVRFDLPQYRQNFFAGQHFFFEFQACLVSRLQQTTQLTRNETYLKLCSLLLPALGVWDSPHLTASRQYYRCLDYYHHHYHPHSHQFTCHASKTHGIIAIHLQEQQQRADLTSLSPSRWFLVEISHAKPIAIISLLSIFTDGSHYKEIKPQFFLKEFFQANTCNKYRRPNRTELFTRILICATNIGNSKDRHFRPKPSNCLKEAHYLLATPC